MTDFIEIYHIYNRTVAKDITCFNNSDKIHFLNLIQYYKYPQEIRYSKFNLLSYNYKFKYVQQYLNKDPIVEIYAFSIMPNHYHFLLKPLTKNGITNYLKVIQNSFAKYFNLKHNRNGSLFQNRFKSRIINNNQDFIEVSRYIHLNPVNANIISFQTLPTYPFSSLYHYNNDQQNGFINTTTILNYFGSFSNYQRFLKVKYTS